MDIKYNPKCKLISDLITVLYNTDGCGAGGCCHIVTDDQNLYDDNLQFVIDYCKREDNKDCIDKELSSLICELLLQLSFEQRVIFFEIYEWSGQVDESSWEKYLHNISEQALKRILKEYDYYEEFYK